MVQWSSREVCVFMENARSQVSYKKNVRLGIQACFFWKISMTHVEFVVSLVNIYLLGYTFWGHGITLGMDRSG